MSNNGVHAVTSPERRCIRGTLRDATKDPDATEMEVEEALHESRKTPWGDCGATAGPIAATSWVWNRATAASWGAVQFEKLARQWDHDGSIPCAVQAQPSWPQQLGRLYSHTKWTGSYPELSTNRGVSTWGSVYLFGRCGGDEIRCHIVL